MSKNKAEIKSLLAMNETLNNWNEDNQQAPLSWKGDHFLNNYCSFMYIDSLFRSSSYTTDPHKND